MLVFGPRDAFTKDQSTEALNFQLTLLIGYIAGDPRPTEQLSWIVTIAVDPTHQRRGIGRAVLAELIKRAKASGMAAMVGGIDSTNAGSISLHQQAGFEIQGNLKGVGRKFGKSLDLVFMVKAL